MFFVSLQKIIKHNTMSKLFKLMVLAVLAASSLAIVSCSDDDEPNVEVPEVDSQWITTDFGVQFQTHNKLAGFSNKGVFTGAYSINDAENQYSYDVTFANGEKESKVKNKYVQNNNTLTLEFCGVEYTLNKSSSINNSLIGKWELINRSQFPSFYTINILSNGKFEVVYEPGESIEPGGFEWKVNGSKLTLYFDTEYGHDDYLIGEFVVIGNEMRYSNNYEEDESGKFTSTFIMRRL